MARLVFRCDKGPMAFYAADAIKSRYLKNPGPLVT